MLRRNHPDRRSPRSHVLSHPDLDTQPATVGDTSPHGHTCTDAHV